ncbi:MAG: hypothetical protein EXR98_03120 [Gemmataceae bacterium]|nr:hypothetical protein [Gemmataceae bacterium]
MKQAVTLPAREYRKVPLLAKIYQDAGEIAKAEPLLHALLDEAKRWYERQLEPALAAPADTSAQARRHLAVLLGVRGATAQATALLDEN